ncbi:TRAP transporter, DctM subunit [Tessaracoccus oleiagri]|uniref:TRAP transporter, DctM subunit n=2 Tax=Tessaracoccus oleiagri TaxID=686624 RepID=A0A1G9HCM2_9ACTN|nr:TRAP transporter, DctM subunit [Tessaracoccus oleiagri]
MMDNTVLVLGVVALLLAFLAIRMPVAFALALSGGIGLLLLRDFDFVTNMMGSRPFDETSRFTLTIIPMFILMGMLAVKARIAEQVYAVAAHVFRRLPGGLGVATVMACAGFAAVSGSSIGTAATMSKLSVGEMRKHGYPTSLATATVAVAGTLGVLIPPSVILVLYAIMTGESVAKVLAAGIIPGIISTLAYAAYIMWALPLANRKRATKLGDALDQASAAASGAAEAPAPRQRLRDLPMRGVVRVAILFFIVLGGMYSGIFTPTESAAVGALAAMVMLVAEMYKEGWRATLSAIVEGLKETAGTTSMVFAIIVGSSLLSVFFVAAKVPQMLTNAVVDLGMNPHLTMGLLLLTLLPLGMALESISILVITVPLLYPVAEALGFDGIWLAILIVKLIEIGMVTPPVGINCFVVAGTSGVRVSEIFKGVFPFVVVDLAVTALLFAFPGITLWLPSLVTF